MKPWIPIVCAVLSGLMAFAADLKLAENGKTPYRIVLPDDAIPAEKTGAEELQSHLKSLCGVKFPIIAAADYTSGPMIAVGFNAKLPEALQEARYPGLSDEELVIDANGDTLLLAGGRPRGSLYAVYQFLERLGVRWCTPTETFLPERKELLAADVTPERYKSPFIFRTQVAGNKETPEWSARNRLNSFMEWGNPGEKYGGGVFQGPGMETFFIYLSRADMDAHPEWLAEVDGKREASASGASWGVCLSNEALRAELVKRALDWARRNPTATAVWLAQNDGSPYCHCAKCMEFYAAHGNQPSSMIVLLLNELAAEVAKEFPKMQVKTLAYAWSEPPPENMKLADNVSVMFCAGIDFRSTLGRDPQGSTMVKNFQNWKKVAKNFEVYLYGHPSSDYWAPNPCLYSQARNIRWAYENGITQLHHQFFGWMGQPGGELVYLRLWVYTRLDWNPLLDPVALVEEFCRNYYGPVGGKVMFDAITEYHRKVESGDLSMPERGLPFVPDYVDIELVHQLAPRMEAVYSQLEEPYKKRFGYAMLPMLWADYWSNIKTLCQYDAAKKTWGVELADRERNIHLGKLLREIMIENDVRTVGQDKDIKPEELRLDDLALEHKAVELSNDKLSVVVVPDYYGKMIDFVLKSDGFRPLKAAWGVVIMWYPRFGYWSEYFNGRYADKMTVVKQTDTMVELECRRDDGTAMKKLELDGDTLKQTWKFVPTQTMECDVKLTPLFDLLDQGFGTYPTLKIGLKSGGSRDMVMGKAGFFWYYDGSLDLTDFNGVIQLVAEDGKHTLELTMDPAQTASLFYMYDRYNCPPKGTNQILELTIQAKKKEVQAGAPFEFHMDMRVRK